MRSFLTFFVVLLLASPVFGQTASEKIKTDSAIAAQGLSAEELDKLVEAAKERAKLQAEHDKAEAVKARIKEMLEADAQLKSDLMNE